MSDSVSGADVEDVLASVRRLISNDSRSLHAAPAASASASADDGRLLLTPALRVEGGSEAPVMAAAPKAVAGRRPDASAQADESLEQRIAELEAAVSRSPGDWEPDGSEDQTQHRPRRMIRSRDPDAPRQPPLKLSRLAPVDVPLDAGPVIEDAFRLEEDDDPDAIEDAEIVSTFPPAEVDDDIDPSVDDDPMDDEREPQTAHRVRELYGDELDDEVFADEALRLLVSALIREELQGELGERITRNVRKLVRREIQRALAARDLS